MKRRVLQGHAKVKVSIGGNNKMLSYLRETVLQGATAL